MLSAQSGRSISGAAFDWLIADHYALGAQWERQVRRSARWLMAIDDLADRDHDCDALLDQNLVQGMISRYASRVPRACATLLGTDYALLRPQFLAARQTHDRSIGPVRRVFVFLGGSDLGNETSKAVRALLGSPEAWQEADVLIGPANPHIAEVRSLSAGDSRMRLHQGADDVAPMMAAADLAIGAGGTNTWERCCVGLPSAVVAIAENQEPICEALSSAGCLDYLGRSVEVTVGRMRAALARLAADLPARRRQHFVGRRLVDGFGTRRVARSLSESGIRMLSLRRATPQDADLYLRWANDPEVRSQSISMQAIEVVQHRRWFADRIADPDARLWLAQDSRGVPVGQVRLEATGCEWRLDYSIATEHRGAAHAWPMLDLAFRALRDEVGSGTIVAEVKEGNRRSQKVLAALGCSALPGHEGGIIRFRCTFGGGTACGES